MSFIFRPIKRYAKELRSAPAAQYAVSTSAPAVTPNLTPSPPPSYQPRERTPTYREQDPATARIRRAETSKGKIGIFDRITKLAGSRWTFLGVLCLLALWAVVGAINGPSDTWQVIFQDVSSIQCYISATLLMRQQQTSTRGLLTTICSMISRAEANERMVSQLSEKQLLKLRGSKRPTRTDLNSALELKENIFDRVANAVSNFLGSLLALTIYWTGIIVWFFLGFPLQFSDTWQLYVNTATALSLTFCTMFLQSVRRQHEEYLEKCLRSITIAEEDLEMDLRELTGDISPNPIVAAEPIKLNWMEKFIDIWAFVLGGSLGVALSVSVTVAWLSVGNLMDFDDNWWLIIGTYTGLMGFIDGFVLRNVHSRETAMADRHFERLLNQDFKLFYLLEIPLPEDVTLGKKRTVVEKVSYFIGHMIEVPIATLGSVAVVIGLISIASAMQWTETGQLLCNTPTMIVEGFLLLMLISGHNGAESKRRRQYTDVLTRRLALDRRISAWDDDWELDVKLLGEKGLQAELEKYAF